MNLLEVLTHLAIILAVLKYLGIFSLFQQYLPTHLAKDESEYEDEVEDEVEEYYLGKSDPTAVEAETMANYLPGDGELFDPSNFEMAVGLYASRAYDDFESRFYNVETGVEET